MNCMKKHSGRRTFLRRAVSLTLTAALLLGQVITSAAAAGSSLMEPTQVTNIADFPNVDIELNVVQDSFGKLTGFVELALRVKTPSWLSDPSNPDSAKEYKYFRSISATLSYDPEVLAPVSWELLPDETDGSVTPDISLAGAGSYSVQFPVKKCDTITGSVAQSGDSTTPGVAGGKSLLFFNAESYKPVKFDGLTTLAVIRFWVKSDDKFSFDTDGTTLLYGGAATSADNFIGFATDDEIKSSGSPAAAALWYRAEDNEFYFVPEYADDNTKTQNKTVIVKGTTYTITAPATKNEMVQAKKAGETAETTPNPQDYYSYLTNLIPDGNITRTLVSKESFAGGGVSVDSVATIIFLDWDNTILGTQIVPKKTDVRKLVNDYVRDTFIHPDIAAAPDNASLARKDNYRGKYEFSGPAPAPAPGTPDVTPNGGEFPLTNKLDYVFFKRPMEQEMDTTTDPANPTPTGKWIQKADTTGADPVPVYDNEFAYTYGWAECNSQNYKNTWTTLASRGELSNYAVDANGVASVSYSGNPDFSFIDFEKGITASTVYAKAVYEPGEDLLGTSSTYTMTKMPYYTKYNAAGVASGGAFVVEFAYERIGNGGAGVQGVSKIRELVVQLVAKPDLMNFGVSNDSSASMYLRLDTVNTETVDVALSLSGKIYSSDYYLIDGYGNNFVSGAQRTASNAGQPEPVSNNFTYTTAENANDVKWGSDGFVLRCTINSFAEKAKTKIDGTDTTSFNSYISVNTVNDINLRDAAGNKFVSDSFISNGVSNKVYTAYQTAWTNNWKDAKGNPYLSWHQLQNYLSTGTMLSEAAADARVIPWCRLHAVCIAAGGEKDITSFAEMIEGALEVINGTNPNALTKLQSTYCLRTGIKATEFASIDAFKPLLIAAIQTLKTAGVADADILAMSWKQAQYLLDHPGTTSLPGTVTDDYWWESGGKKTIPDISTLLTVAYNIKANGYDPSWLNGLTTAQVKTLLLRKSATGAEFTNVNSFKDALYLNAAENALDKLMNAPGTYTGANIGTVPVMELQHVLIPGTTFRTDSDLRGDSAINYYWITGAPTITDLKSLLNSAWLVYEEGAPGSLLDSVDMVLVNGLYLRKNIDGDPFGGVASFKVSLKDAMDALKVGGLTQADMAAVSWDEFQNVLLGNVYASDPVPDAGLFWWKNGGYKPVNTYADMLKAAWLAYGVSPENPDALNGLTNIDMVNGITGTPDPTKFFLRADTEGTDFTLPTVKAALKLAVDKVQNMGQSFVEGLSWIELQHLLLPGTGYRTEASLRADLTIKYWWENGNTKPVGVDVDAAVAEINLKIFDVVYAGGTTYTQDDVDAALAKYLPDLHFRKYGTNPDEYGVADAAQFQQLYTDAITNAWSYPTCEPDFTDSDWAFLEFTWTEVQYFLINGGSVESNESGNIPPYSWKPSGTAFFLRDLGLEDGAPTTTVETTSVVTETAPETGAVTETSAATTTVREIDTQTGTMTITATTVTTTKRTVTEEGGVRETVTVSTVVNVVTVNLFTGKAESRTEVKPSAVTETFTPAETADKPEEPGVGDGDPAVPPTEEKPEEPIVPEVPEQKPELPEEQPDTPTENPDVPEQKPETPEQQPEDPTEDKPVEKPEPETPSLPPEGETGEPEIPSGPPETEVGSLRWVNPSVRSADSSPFRGAKVSSAVSLAPFTKGSGAANGRGGGISLTPWAAPPWSVQLRLSQNQGSLWAGLPIIGRLTPSQIGTISRYGPILGIRTGT